MFSKSSLKKIFKFFIAGTLIYWMVKKGLLDVSLLTQLLTPGHILIGFGLIFLNIYINNYRWAVLLASQNLPAGIRLTFPLTLIGLFFNFAVPGAVGGDLVKAYYVAQDYPGRKMAAATTVLFDRMIGLYSMVLLAVLTMFSQWDLVWHRLSLRNVFFSCVGILIAMTVFLALLFSSRVKEKNPFMSWISRCPGGTAISKFYDAVHVYGNNPKVILWTLFLSLLSQVIAVIYMVYVGFAVGESIPLATYFFAVPLGFIIMAIPISPAGIGVGQVAFLVLFRLFTGDEKNLVGQTVITAYQIGLLCWSLIGAWIYAQRKKPEVLPQVTSI